VLENLELLALQRGYPTTDLEQQLAIAEAYRQENLRIQEDGTVASNAVKKLEEQALVRGYPTTLEERQAAIAKAHEDHDLMKRVLKNSFVETQGSNQPMAPEKPMPNSIKVENFAIKEKRFFGRFFDRVRANIGGR